MLRTTLAKDVKLRLVAERTPGFSGADLSNVLNEAAILTGRQGQKKLLWNIFTVLLKK